MSLRWQGVTLPDRRRAIVVMGVAGCGKSAVAEGLAAARGVPMIEGDALHPVTNIHKMSAETPLADLEREIAALAPTVAAKPEHEPPLRDAQATLAAAKERLQSLRRAGAELTDEMTQSFTQSFERLQSSVGRLRAAVSGQPHAA